MEGYRTPLLYFTLYQIKKKLSLVSTEGDLTRRFILSLYRIDGYSFHRFETDLFSRSTLNNEKAKLAYGYLLESNCEKSNA